MSAKLAILFHPLFLEHIAGPMHPERPERLTAVMDSLRGDPLWAGAVHSAPREASMDDLRRCHTAHHLDRIQNASVLGRNLDPDTGTSTDSWEAAKLAAGAGPTAADLIMDGTAGRAFCAVRPPGHHAESDRAMGFCLVNNAAVAARYLQESRGVERVAIVDFDAHHGNGTQEIFYEDGSVLYASTHQWPLYPGTGSDDETGRGDGVDTTVNCPMPAGAGIAEFGEAFRRTIVPALDGFKPGFLLVSAGFDSHRDDPLTDLGLQTEDFATLTGMLVECAERNCEGRMISFLEGGYDLKALSESCLAHVKTLAD